jgi:hypothetical protein
MIAVVLTAMVLGKGMMVEANATVVKKTTTVVETAQMVNAPTVRTRQTPRGDQRDHSPKNPPN